MSFKATFSTVQTDVHTTPPAEHVIQRYLLRDVIPAAACMLKFAGVLPPEQVEVLEVTNGDGEPTFVATGENSDLVWVGGGDETVKTPFHADFATPGILELFRDVEL